MEGFWSSLAIRSRTAAILAPLTILFIILGGVFLAVFITVVIFFGLIEFLRLLRSEYPILTLPTLIPPLLIPLLVQFRFPPISILIVLAILILFVTTILAPIDRFLITALIPSFSLIYLGLFPTTLLLLRRIDLYLALTPILITWVSDTGAYLIGAAIGRHRLAPVLSPRKSWEGLLGGIITGLLTALLLGLIFPYETSPRLLIAGITIPIIALLGDLFESGLKRQFGVKDTSTLLPGHGGVLDRIDSLLLVIPYFYLLVIL